jgi:hypothetical protein
MTAHNKPDTYHENKVEGNEAKSGQTAATIHFYNNVGSLPEKR